MDMLSDTPNREMKYLSIETLNSNIKKFRHQQVGLILDSSVLWISEKLISFIV